VKITFWVVGAASRSKDRIKGTGIGQPRKSERGLLPRQKGALSPQREQSRGDAVQSPIPSAPHKQITN